MSEGSARRLVPLPLRSRRIEPRPQPLELSLVDETSPSPLGDAPELWLALHLPQLPLDALGEAVSPLAVVDTDGRVQQILAADEQARRAGVRSGMTLAAALVLLPELETRLRDPRREQALLEQLAARSLAFTPRVSLEPPDALLLEVRGSLRLFGGPRPLARELVSACAALGARVQPALAPTPLGALAGARAGERFIVRHRAQLAGRLSMLPLAVLRWPPPLLERLAAVGVRTVGEALRLPRASFARRFGAASLEMLDRLVGRRAEPRRAFRARERFRARFEPSFELADRETILAALAPLLADLERFLRSRQCGIASLACSLAHRERPPSVQRLRLARPAFEAAHFAALLREQLMNVVLPAPVTRCELRSGPLIAGSFEADSLWRAGEQGGEAGREASAFIERLRARLGADAVQSLCLLPDHRPEETWRTAEPGGIAAAPAPQTASRPRSASPASTASLPWSPFRRPLWLLREPQPLAAREGGLRGVSGRLRILEGPERIESGWWDGRDVARDYYVAQDERGARYWIYRERMAPRGWFLHGVFG